MNRKGTGQKEGGRGAGQQSALCSVRSRRATVSHAETRLSLPGGQRRVRLSVLERRRGWRPAPLECGLHGAAPRRGTGPNAAAAHARFALRPRNPVSRTAQRLRRPRRRLRSHQPSLLTASSLRPLATTTRLLPLWMCLIPEVSTNGIARYVACCVRLRSRRSGCRWLAPFRG